MRDRWKDEKKILSEAEKNYPSAMKIIDYRGEREFLGRKQEQFLSNKIERKERRENIELNGGLNPERLLRYQGSFVRAISFSHSSLDPIFDHSGKRATRLEYKHRGSKKLERRRKF